MVDGIVNPIDCVDVVIDEPTSEYVVLIVEISVVGIVMAKDD